ncbi:MAG: PPC domain-containing protein [Anaerolineae bacterium]|nr:PPC domain-containing protein [Anaerolineae bacterium]
MGFEDLDDLSELDEMPSFGEDLDLAEFEEPSGGGISRTFKVLGFLLLSAVVVIIILLVVFGLRGGDDLSDNDKTSTAVIQTNTAVAENYGYTQTAIEVAIRTSQEYIMTFEAEATLTQSAFEAQQTQDAISANSTATANAIASQTAAAEASNQTATSQKLTEVFLEENTLTGKVVDEEDSPFENLTIRLYRDDGDGVFNPPGSTPVPEVEPGETEEPLEAEAETGGEELSESGEESTGPDLRGAAPIVYGDSVESTLETDATALWAFEGTAGDVVTISATAGPDDLQVDTYLQLFGPDGSQVAEDDDGGSGLNAAIQNYPLPTDGTYVIQVTNISQPGAFTLELSGPSSEGNEASAEEPADEGGDVSGYEPGAGGRLLSIAQQRRRQDEGPTPTPEIGIDELIDTITTGPDGSFDFGSLEPGTYWLEADYDSLPAELQAQIPPTERVVIKIEVPTTGDVIFTISAAPTPTPDYESVTQTMAAIATASAGAPVTPSPYTGSPGAIMSITPSPEGTLTASPTALGQTGIFSDISDKSDDIDSTSGLTVLAIAAAGLVAVVFIARKLRNSA